ncbi:cytochrome P450 [Paraconexibacter sp.]|uniref:cytochrome P450 n=1 Tax=Paraconexibacter sp. TaxID=2949640 RepID=UPI003564D659
MSVPDASMKHAAPLEAFLQSFAGTTWDMAEVFSQLREDAPVVYVPILDMWVVSRYEDVVVALRDVERFVQPVGVMGEVPAEFAADLPGGYALSHTALTNANPPDHTRIRKLAQKPLTPRAVLRYEDMIRGVANDLVDRFADAGRADLVQQYAFPLSVTVMANVLGIPSDRHEDFRRWVLGTFELMVPTLTPQRRAELARDQVEFSAFVRDTIAERRAAPGDDLISGLVQAREGGEPGLSESECLGVVAQLITGGFETTQGTIGLALNTLCEDRALLDRVLDDPGLLPSLVDETVRRFCPARGVFRDTTCDVTLHGQVIPQGARLFVLIGAANQDPAQFDCPFAFDVDRDPGVMRRHVGFGQGIHKCIGIALAQLDIRIALEVLLSRLPGLRLVDGEDRPLAMGFVFSTPQRLVCAWDHHTTAGA